MHVKGKTSILEIFILFMGFDVALFSAVATRGRTPEIPEAFSTCPKTSRLHQNSVDTTHMMIYNRALNRRVLRNSRFPGKQGVKKVQQ